MNTHVGLKLRDGSLDRFDDTRGADGVKLNVAEVEFSTKPATPIDASDSPTTSDNFSRSGRLCRASAFDTSTQVNNLVTLIGQATDRRAAANQLVIGMCNDTEDVHRALETGAEE